MGTQPDAGPVPRPASLGLPERVKRSHVGCGASMDSSHEYLSTYYACPRGRGYSGEQGAQGPTPHPTPTSWQSREKTNKQDDCKKARQHCEWKTWGERTGEGSGKASCEKRWPSRLEGHAGINGTGRRGVSRQRARPVRRPTGRAGGDESSQAGLPL